MGSRPEESVDVTNIVYRYYGYRVCSRLSGLRVTVTNETTGSGNQ
jgi:hypothetical protein